MKAAVLVHVGPYSKLSETWDKLKKWLDQSKRQKGRDSCEIYDDFDNEGKKKDTELKTTVYILLKKE